MQGVLGLSEIPFRPEAFADFVRSLFLSTELSTVVVRTVNQPSGLSATVAYITGMMNVADLERFVLQPLSAELPGIRPDDLSGFSRFVAPDLQLAADGRTVKEGLGAGMAAVHVDGSHEVLLVGSGPAAGPPSVFGPELNGNMVLLRRLLRSPNLRVELLPGAVGNRNAVVYLEGVARRETVQAVRTWAGRLGPQRPALSWWQALLGLLRLPQSVENSAPSSVAEALRRGYVAVLADHLPAALLAPSTLELLLSSRDDLTLSPLLRRLVTWPRLVATTASLFLEATFVAISSYHHSLLSGPFLIALAAGRQNLPFPMAVDVILMALLDDALTASSARLGGDRFPFHALFGTALVGMVAVQAGILGPAAVMVGIAGTVLRKALPNHALGRCVRIWRYLFLTVAAGLGLFGMALLHFALMVYLAQERSFGHPFRRPPAAVSQ